MCDDNNLSDYMDLMYFFYPEHTENAIYPNGPQNKHFSVKN